jgi:MFS family permease
VTCVVVGVEDAPRRREGVKEVRGAAPPIRLADLRGLDRAWWRVAGVGVVFTLARFSEAFLVLRAHQQGLAPALAPLVLVAMNAVYMVAAYPAGVYADRGDPRRLLRWGAAVLVAADLTLAGGSGVVAAFGGIALWGLHLALTQGLFAKLVADATPESLRGSAFGLFNLLTGGALLAASIVAGLLWDILGASATFVAGAGFAAVAGVASFALLPGGRSAEDPR